MKRFIIPLLVFFCAQFTYSQDFIYKIDDTEIRARIIEVNEHKIKYKEFEHPDSLTLSIELSNVSMIVFEDGTRRIFKIDESTSKQIRFNKTEQTLIAKPEPSITKPDIENDMYALLRDPCQKGILDASSHYSGYRRASTTTFAISTIFGLFGLIPAILTSTSNPNISSLNIPDPTLANNTKYYNCYFEEARKTKVKKVWTWFGIGIGVNTFLIIAIASNWFTV